MGKFIFGFGFCLFLIIVLKVFISEVDDRNYCLSKGGVLVKTFWGRACIKAERIPLPDSGG